MSWLYYLAEANLYLGIFYLAYCLFLNRNTHYQLSRVYLIFSCVVSFVLPVVQLGALRPVQAAEPLRVVHYALTGTTGKAAAAIPQTPAPVASTASNMVVPTAERHFSLQDGLWYAYFTGAGVVTILLFVKLCALFRLMRNARCVSEGGYRVVYLPGTDIGFSFFHYLFIGSDAPGANTIIRHELVHIRQKHSADIIFLELFKIINWFNPLVYLLQNSLKTVHEYIADEQTAAYETDALSYSSFLLNNAYGMGGSSITHSFFNYNLLKKRIIMLNQQRSGKLARLRYLVTVPICAALLCASTLVFSKTYGWVDIAPAHVKAAGTYATHTGKRKRLKVTQNGVTMLTDRLALDQNNRKAIYTAGTITKADKSELLKNDHIKVEVVEDSTQFTTKDGRPMLPVVNVDGYYELDHFLHHNVRYTTGKGEKGGLVEVGFTLDNDRHITNAHIVKSGGQKLDALALDGFNAYKGVVNDDAGKNLEIGAYFFTNDYSIFKTDSLGKDAEFAGELIITNYKYPEAVTSKGYEYVESGIGLPGSPDNTTYAKVVIFDKNGKANWYYKKKCTPADLKMLNDKYGYTFPSAASEAIGFFYPQDVRKNHLAYIFDAASYLNQPYANHFYNEVLNTTEYPAQAKKALAGGVVVLNFNLNARGMISNVHVVQGAGYGFDETAVAALQSYKFAINDAEGKHSIAMVFCVAEKKYRPAVNAKFKKAGYVGELAICDVKSAFGPAVSKVVKFPPPLIKADKDKN